MKEKREPVNPSRGLERALGSLGLQHHTTLCIDYVHTPPENREVYINSIDTPHIKSIDTSPGGIVDERLAQTTCQHCGAAIDDREVPGGEHQRFCSAKCRLANWRQRQSETGTNSTVSTPYTNKGGYILNRFNGSILNRFNGFDVVECPETPPDFPPIGSINVHLDWLTYTVAWPLGNDATGSQNDMHNVLAAAVFISDVWKLEPGVKVKPLYGYKGALKLSYGTLHFNAAKPELRIMVSLTGSDLEGLRREGFSDEALLDWVHQAEGKITRLDVAIDYFDKANPLDLQDAYISGKAATAVEKTTEVANRDISGKLCGVTVYFGGASSARRLRVYDKASQLEIQEPWTRIELVLRENYAANVANAMRDVGITDAGRAAIRSFFDTQYVPWYMLAVTGPTVEVASIARKDSKTVKWLKDRVLPVLERCLIETMAEGDWCLYDDFQAALDMSLRRLGNQPDSVAPTQESEGE